FHGELCFQTCLVARERRHCGDPAARPVADGAVTACEAAIDLDRIPALGVTDVVDRDIVKLGPKEWNIREGRAVADDGPGAGLPLTSGPDPWLDPDEPTATRIWPAGSIPDREHARCRCFQVAVHDDPVVDPQSRLFGKRGHRPNTHAGHHEICTDPIAVLKHHRASLYPPRRLAEMVDDAVVVVMSGD